LLPDLTAIVIENSTAQELPLALADAGRRNHELFAVKEPRTTSQ
jgi:hypothetical protein